MGRYKGRLISAVGPSTSNTKYTGSASGFWSLSEAVFYKANSLWPKGLSVPDAPTISSVTGSDASAFVYFTAPTDNGGVTITSYTVTSSPGNISASGSTSPITISGLTNLTAYTFTITATSPQGTGLPSASSASVTPNAAPYNVSYLVVGGGGAGGGGIGPDGGGGGGGSVRTASGFSITPGIAYTVIVGAGGSGYVSNVANNGSDSKFYRNDTLVGSDIGYGGGGGGTASNAYPTVFAYSTGRDGGNGGGAGSAVTETNAIYGGTALFGNNGGTWYRLVNSQFAGAGGGGAGGAPTRTASYNTGGAAAFSSITGTSQGYGGGGGGGGYYSVGSYAGGTNAGTSGNSPVLPVANYGGGGSTQQSGGSGVVVISSPQALGSATGATLTMNGSLYVYTFTGSGSFVG